VSLAIALAFFIASGFFEPWLACLLGPVPSYISMERKGINRRVGISRSRTWWKYADIRECRFVNEVLDGKPTEMTVITLKNGKTSTIGIPGYVSIESVRSILSENGVSSLVQFENQGIVEPAPCPTSFGRITLGVALFFVLWLPLYWYGPGAAMVVLWSLFVFLAGGVCYSSLVSRTK
jgi:hypothetical protein